MKTQITVFWPVKKAPDIEEVSFSYDFCKKISRNNCLNGIPACQWKDYIPGSCTADMTEQAEGEYLLVVTDPETVLTAEAVTHMTDVMEKGNYPIAVPVFNETPFTVQQAELFFRYINMSTYLEIVKSMSERTDKGIIPISRPDPACILYRRDSFVRFGDMLSFSSSSEPIETGAVVDKDALVHRFGNYYHGERPDLAQLVPESVKNLLDVGCAMGGYGRKLRQMRPDIVLTGVEMNPLMAEAARKYYDRIIDCPIEKADLTCDFDLINCGDVIEHIMNPWDMLKHFYKLLRPNGFLVLSIPNAGHWSIVRDLLKGEFPYIPVGLTCITHIRWFTESSIRQALENSGFSIEILQKAQIPPTPEGSRFIRDMCEKGYGNEDSLLTNEITIRAVKKCA